MSLKALIFDVDGTLADTEEAHRVAFNLAFERYGLGWRWSRTEYRRWLAVAGGKERLRSYIDTLDVQERERRCLREKVQLLHAEKTRFYAALVRDGGLPLRPGIRRLLSEAQAAGCRLAIATTTTVTNVQTLLNATLGPNGAALFSVIVGGDKLVRKKPDPEVYRRALRELGVAAIDSVALEDSANGLRAARAAGLWTVVTPTGWSEDEDFSGAGLVLPHLGDPDNPVPGEPGRQLPDSAWLDFHTLCRLAPAASQRAAAAHADQDAW